MKLIFIAIALLSPLAHAHDNAHDYCVDPDNVPRFGSYAECFKAYTDNENVHAPAPQPRPRYISNALQSVGQSLQAGTSCISQRVGNQVFTQCN